MVVWLGHMTRMSKDKRAKQVITWIRLRAEGGKGKTEKEQVTVQRPSAKTCEEGGLTWKDGLDAAEDRDRWRRNIVRFAVLHGRD